MAMPYRAKREIDFSTKATPNRVGPGSYESSSAINRSNPSFVPFSTTEERRLNDNKTTSATTPGPGTYNVSNQVTLNPKDLSQDTVAGTSSFRTQGPRFAPVAPGSTVFKESDIAHTPGPGRYNLNISWQRKDKIPPKPTTPKYEIQYKPTVPAIPRPDQSHGYEEKDGSLILQKNKTTVYSGLGKDTVGPAFYNPNYSSVYSARSSYVDIARNQIQRKLFEADRTRENWLPDKSNPGPGYYDIFNKTQINQVEETRPSAVFASRVPNASEVKVSGKDATPGPGEYSVEDGLAKTTAVALEKNKFGNRSFGSDTDRKGWNNNIAAPYSTPWNYYTPGPGSYAGSSSASAAINLLYGRRVKTPKVPENVGFNSAGERDCLSSKVADDKPGPGYYSSDHESTSLRGKIEKTACLGRKGVFGTTTNRFFGSDLHKGIETARLPGPGQYESPVHDRNRKQITSVFSSKSERFKTSNALDEEEDEEEEAMMDTNVNTTKEPKIERYNELQTPNSTNQNQNEALSERYPFASSAPRFGANTVFADVIQSITPGPGTYNLADTVKWGNKPLINNPVLVSFHTNDRRFKQDAHSYLRSSGTTDVVGPGSYDTPNYLLKKSFNVSVGSTKKKGKKGISNK